MQFLHSILSEIVPSDITLPDKKWAGNATKRQRIKITQQKGNPLASNRLRYSPPKPTTSVFFKTIIDITVVSQQYSTLQYKTF